MEFVIPRNGSENIVLATSDDLIDFSPSESTEEEI
jgi:hypothetical protein